MSFTQFQSIQGPTDSRLTHSELEGYQPVSRIGEVVLNSFVDAYEFAQIPETITRKQLDSATFVGDGDTVEYRVSTKLLFVCVCFFVHAFASRVPIMRAHTNFAFHYDSSLRCHFLHVFTPPSTHQLSHVYVCNVCECGAPFVRIAAPLSRMVHGLAGHDLHFKKAPQRHVPKLRCRRNRDASHQLLRMPH